MNILAGLMNILLLGVGMPACSTGIDPRIHSGKSGSIYG